MRRPSGLNAAGWAADGNNEFLSAELTRRSAPQDAHFTGEVNDGTGRHYRRIDRRLAGRL
jgi:hypothetical protein